MENNFCTNLDTLFSNMENFVSSKTVVGEPVNIDGTIIVPLVDVSVGLGVGGGGKKDNNDTSGGGGLGAKITPSAVLVINKDGVQLVNVKDQNTINKIIDMVPGLLSKFNLKKEDKEDKKNEKEKDDVFE